MSVGLIIERYRRCDVILRLANIVLALKIYALWRIDIVVRRSPVRQYRLKWDVLLGKGRIEPGSGASRIEGA